MPFRSFASAISWDGLVDRRCISCFRDWCVSIRSILWSLTPRILRGKRITQNLFHKIRAYGIDVVTLGDHVYKKLDIVGSLQTSERIVRPANLAADAAGKTFTVVTTNSGVSVAIFCRSVGST